MIRALIIAILAAGFFTPAAAGRVDGAVSSAASSDAAVELIDPCCHESHAKVCRIPHSYDASELLAPGQPEPDPPSQIAQSYIDIFLSRFPSELSNVALSELHSPLVGTSIYLTTLRLRL